MWPTHVILGQQKKKKAWDEKWKKEEEEDEWEFQAISVLVGALFTKITDDNVSIFSHRRCSRCLEAARVAANFRVFNPNYTYTYITCRARTRVRCRWVSVHGLVKAELHRSGLSGILDSPNCSNKRSCTIFDLKRACWVWWREYMCVLCGWFGLVKTTMLCMCRCVRFELCCKFSENFFY